MIIQISKENKKPIYLMRKLQEQMIEIVDREKIKFKLNKKRNKNRMKRQRKFWTVKP